MGSTNKASSARGCSYPEPSFSQIKEHNNTYSDDHCSLVLYLPRPVHDGTEVMYFIPDEDRGDQDSLKWTGTWSQRAVPTLKRPSCPQTRVVFGGGLLYHPPALKNWPKCLRWWKTGGSFWAVKWDSKAAESVSNVSSAFTIIKNILREGNREGI